MPHGTEHPTVRSNPPTVRSNPPPTVLNTHYTGWSGGYGKIPPKLVSLSADVLAKPFMHVVNSGIHSHTFPDCAKVAVVTPVFKKDNRHNKQNFRPISVLNTFSKVFENYLFDQLNTYFESILSQFVSAYRKHFSTQHVLLRLVEEWRQGLDNNKVVGAVLMDLSKAFDCLSHDLVIAKLTAYVLGDGALQIIYSYLKNCRQSVKVKGVISLLKVILVGVSQGLLLAPLLFNIVINDMFCFITSNLHNFADDITLSAVAESLQILVNELEHQAKKAIDWLQMKQMIANPEKFKAIVLKRLNAKEDLNVNLQINDIRITTSSEVDLLGVTIDSKLTFDSYIRNICKKASRQLNALFRLNRYLLPHQRKVLTKSFVFANFNYCPMVWHLCSCKNVQKMERIHKRALRFMLNDFYSDYQTLIAKEGTPTLEMKQIQAICTKVYKSLKKLNPPYMKDLFVPRQNDYILRGSQNLSVPRVHTTMYGLQSIGYEGASLWNRLLESLKTAGLYMISDP